MTPFYREYAPSLALAPWVACYWAYRGGVSTGLPHRVLPDGCADIIVELATDANPIAVGTMRTALVAPLGPDTFGIRFRPGRARAFLGVPLDLLSDRREELGSVWDGRRRTLHRRLVDGVAGTTDDRARVAAAERVLRECVADESPEQALVARVVSMCEAGGGRRPVRDVVAAVGAGPRRLERLFASHVGVSLKELSRVIRFQRLVARLDGGAAPRWSALAYEAGYADQSHLVREFRALAGITPGEYYGGNR